MSAFAINAFLPKLRTMATAASTEVYRTANSSREMPELTEAPLSEDKSKPKRTDPSDFQIVYWPDHLIRHCRCRTQPRKSERWDHRVSHGERDSRHGGHRSGVSARGRPGAIIAPLQWPVRRPPMERKTHQPRVSSRLHALRRCTRAETTA